MENELSRTKPALAAAVKHDENMEDVFKRNPNCSRNDPRVQPKWNSL
jgi:hypothetical protein